MYFENQQTSYYNNYVLMNSTERRKKMLPKLRLTDHNELFDDMCRTVHQTAIGGIRGDLMDQVGIVQDQAFNMGYDVSSRALLATVDDCDNVPEEELAVAREFWAQIETQHFGRPNE
jgi:hypothetical protein